MRDQANSAQGATTYPAMPPGWAERRSGRISRQIPILLIGNDVEGTAFCEKTHTVVLSLHGAGIVSRKLLVAEQELVLRIFGTNREAEIRVVGEIAEEGRLHTYGVAFLNENLDFWGVDFPPAPVWEERPDILTLQCSGCKKLQPVANGEFEYDICVIHGGLPRFCDRCGYLTVWRRSSEKLETPNWKVENRKDAQPGNSHAVALLTPQKPIPLLQCIEEPHSTAGVYSATWSAEALNELVTNAASANLLQIAQAPASSPLCENFPRTGNGAAKQAEDELVVAVADVNVEAKERRERVRAKVNFFACVRTDAFGDDVVKCIDMSKGGVSFKTQHCYTKEMRIEIAVPYAAEAKEAPAIFVRGRIANVAEMEAAGMWRCGVEFLR